MLPGRAAWRARAAAIALACLLSGTQGALRDHSCLRSVACSGPRLRRPASGNPAHVGALLPSYQARGSSCKQARRPRTGRASWRPRGRWQQARRARQAPRPWPACPLTARPRPRRSHTRAAGLCPQQARPPLGRLRRPCRRALAAARRRGEQPSRPRQPQPLTCPQPPCPRPAHQPAQVRVTPWRLLARPRPRHPPPRATAQRPRQAGPWPARPHRPCRPMRPAAPRRQRMRPPPAPQPHWQARAAARRRRRRRRCKKRPCPALTVAAWQPCPRRPRRPLAALRCMPHS